MSLCSLCSLLNLLWMSVCFPIAQQDSCCSSYYRLSALSDLIFNYTVYEWYVMSLQHVRPHTAPTYKSNVNLSAPRVPVFSWRDAPPKSRAAQYWKKNKLKLVSHMWLWDRCKSDLIIWRFLLRTIVTRSRCSWWNGKPFTATFHVYIACLIGRKTNSFLCRYDNGPSYL